MAEQNTSSQTTEHSIHSIWINLNHHTSRCFPHYCPWLCVKTNYLSIHPPHTSIWPTYYMPHYETCILSPTAIKKLQQVPYSNSKNLHSLEITTRENNKITFPSIPTQIKKEILDYEKLYQKYP
jgi:hypothetical protein